MSKPRRASARRYDLVGRLDALTIAGEKPAAVEKKLLDSQGHSPPQSPFVGGFDPELLALNAAPARHRRPPLEGSASQYARKKSGPSQGKPRPESPLEPDVMPMPIPIPPLGKESLTTEYALESIKPTRDTLENPAQDRSARTPPRPRSHPVESLQEELKLLQVAESCPARPATSNETPCRPRSISMTSSSPSPGKPSARCQATNTSNGYRCSRWVKFPATYSRLEPTPALYCYQHKSKMVGDDTSFYVNGKLVKSSRYIPEYLQSHTRLALKKEMESPLSSSDVPGYIYTFEILDPGRPDVILLKVGHADNPNKRLDQWGKQCGSKEQIPRGFWPDDGAGRSLLKGNIELGDAGPFCHRIERLVHIELADLTVHTPYLKPGWPDNVINSSPPVSATSRSRNASIKETGKCPDCGVVHREIFAFPRPKNGQFEGKEWELIVRPVIEKWGNFVRECYS